MLKKIALFIVTYNVLFILMINIQFLYRFDGDAHLVAAVMYSSILSFYFSIVPLVCFGFSWIVYKLWFKKLRMDSVVKSVLFLLMTVMLTYISIERIEQDRILSIIMVSSTILTLSLFIYRNHAAFSN